MSPDARAQYLPNISAANPGKRIDFVTHAVAAQHPDQFAPYKAFGCDLRTPFAGTLFRFPLRTVEQAARSRLSKQVRARCGQRGTRLRCAYIPARRTRRSRCAPS